MDNGYSAIGRALAINARRFPDKPAIIEAQGVRLNYKSFDELANQFANRLIDLGVRKGDRVGVVSGNTAEHIVAIYAISRAGGVSVSFDPKWTLRESVAIQAYVKCSIFIYEHIYSSQFSDAAFSGCEFLEFERDRKNFGLSAYTSGADRKPPSVRVLDDDVSTLLFTSGTTSLPKACIRTNRIIEAGSVKDGQDGLVDIGSELVVVPVNFGSGRGRVMRQVYYGGALHLMESFDAERVARYLSDYKITSVSLAPTMCTRLLRLPRIEHLDFSHLRMLRKAGSPFSSDMSAELIRRVSPQVYQAFASTEAQAVTTLHPHEYESKSGSCGRALFGVELEIVGPDAGAAGPGQEGEIRVRGSQVCQGYYDRPIETAQIFRDGWYHSGDIGRIDADGFLYVVGRTKDMIKTGSINVSPLEVEQAIQTLAEVRDVSIVGVPDPEWGEIVVAIVVAATAMPIALIVEHCRKSLAPYKIPKGVYFVDKIERNSQGKATLEFRQSCVDAYLRSRRDGDGGARIEGRGQILED